MDPSGAQVLRDVVRTAGAAFGERMLACYALGSLAHGGFSPLVSDVDVALILADPGAGSDAESVLGVADVVRGCGSDLHSRVSLFWGTPQWLRTGVGAGRFPPLDRLCLFEHGRLLAGEDVRDRLDRPTRSELLVAGAEFAVNLLADDVVAHAPRPACLLAEGVRRTTKVVLFPARFLFTADTGREGTNDAAAQHYTARHRGPAADLVEAAFRWRAGPPAAGVAEALLDGGLVALYDDYLCDHIARLRGEDQPHLADRFRQWRSRLLAAATAG